MTTIAVVEDNADNRLLLQALLGERYDLVEFDNGGKYTYADVPAFNWLRDHFHLARNHYDRVGHFAQGFVPAMVAREILLRTSPLRPGKWLFFLAVCVCGALSACYELVEWAVAVMSGSASDAFLGTQGDQDVDEQREADAAEVEHDQQRDAGDGREGFQDPGEAVVGADAGPNEHRRGQHEEGEG